MSYNHLKKKKIFLGQCAFIDRLIVERGETEVRTFPDIDASQTPILGSRGPLWAASCNHCVSGNPETIIYSNQFTAPLKSHCLHPSPVECGFYDDMQPDILV